MTASTQPERYDEIFVVEPPNVEFNAYEIGETYELKLTIRNKSALSRRLRVLPPASRHFSVTEMRWPSQHGMLAPGMSCSCSVRFKPDSLADYEDSLTVLSEVMKFELDLRRSATSPQAHPRRRHRRRPRPRGQRRGIPSAVQERRRPGSIPRGGRRGLARARHPLALPNLDAALEPGESPEDDPTPCVRLAPFPVGPGVMDLAPMQWEKLRVGFAPPGPGEFTREFRLVCDNCQVRTFAVRVRGAVLDVAVTRIDSRDAAPGEFANHAVWFGDDVEPGRVKTRRFTVRNATPVPLPFEWEHPSEEGVFVVAPAAGTLAPSAETEFVATFALARGGVVRTTIQTPRGLRVPTSRTTQRRGDVRTTRRGGIRAGGWRRARARRRRRREPRQFRRRAPPRATLRSRDSTHQQGRRRVRVRLARAG